MAASVLTGRGRSSSSSSSLSVTIAARGPSSNRAPRPRGPKAFKRGDEGATPRAFAFALDKRGEATPRAFVLRCI